MNIVIAVPLCRYYPGDEITEGWDEQTVWHVWLREEIAVG